MPLDLVYARRAAIDFLPTLCIIAPECDILHTSGNFCTHEFTMDRLTELSRCRKRWLFERRCKEPFGRPDDRSQAGGQFGADD